MGTSMGGQQSLCTAALNPKVTAVIVNEPSGADANGQAHGRLTGYPNWPADNARALRTARYFDTVNCAARIHAPTLVAMGFTDTTAPPAGIWTAFNRITAPKEAVPMVDSPHNNFATPNSSVPTPSAPSNGSRRCAAAPCRRSRRPSSRRPGRQWWLKVPLARKAEPFRDNRL